MSILAHPPLGNGVPPSFIELVERTPFNSRGVVSLAAALEQTPIDVARALALFLDRSDARSASVLACAAHEVGRTLPAELLARMLVDLEDITLYASLVGAIGGGAAEAVELLVSVVEHGQQSDIRDALALLIATGFLKNAPMEGEPFAGLRRRHRILVRTLHHRGWTPFGGPLLLSAATVDPGLAAEIWGCQVPDEVLYRPSTEWAKGLGKKPSALFDADEETVVVPNTGVPAKRIQPKVGRNDPCPCGSGKKHKNCCLDKPETAAAEPALVQQVNAQTPASVLSELRAWQLARIELSALTSEQLTTIFTRLVDFRRWEPAERVLAEMAKRRPLEVDQWRDDLVSAACDQHELGIARRALESMLVQGPYTETLHTLIAGNCPGIQALEALARLDLPQDTERLFTLAFPLMKTHPALGIVVARGCLNPERLLNSYALLDAIEEARIGLDLLPADGTRAQFEQAVDATLDRKLKDARLDAANWRERRLADDIDRLREEAEAARARLAELDRREHLQKRSEEREAAASPAAPRPTADKVERMKAVVREGQAERAELRRELDAAMAALAAARRPSSASDPQPEGDGSEADKVELEDAADLASNALIRVPTWSPQARAALLALEPRLARQALLLTTSLAASEPATWSQVKRMKRSRETLTARVDRGHRLLFALAPGELMVIDIIPRRDLERWLKNRP